MKKTSFILMVIFCVAPVYSVNIDQSYVAFDPIIASFENLWDGLENSEQLEMIETMEDRLADCRARLPEPDAYEYGLLSNRSTDVVAGIGIMKRNPDDITVAGQTLYLLDALEGEISCKEAEGWEHAPIDTRDEYFVLPPGCEDWTSNRRIVIRDPGTVPMPADTSDRGELGSGWTNDLDISPEISQTQERPSIAVDSNGTLYCAFTVSDPGGGSAVLLYRSLDHGSTWDLVVSNESATYTYLYPSVAVDISNNYVFVVFDKVTASDNHDIVGFIFYSGSILGVAVDTDNGNDQRPCITSEYAYGSNNRMYISYEHLSSVNDREMHCAVSTNSGGAWIAWHNRGYGANYQVHTETAVSPSNGSNVYVTYVNAGDYDDPLDLFVETGPRSGTGSTFEYQILVKDSGPNSCRCPAIACSHGDIMKLVIAYQINETSSEFINYAYTINGGANWTNGRLNNPAFFGHQYPAITVDGMGSSSTSVSGYFYCVYRQSGLMYMRRASDSDLGSWSAWNYENVTSSTSAANMARMTSCTAYQGDDSNWYMGIVWSQNSSAPYDVVYVTKRAKPYTINAVPAALTVKIDGTDYAGGETFNNWIRGSQHTLNAETTQPGGYTFDYWDDGGAQTHDIYTLGGTATTTIQAFYITPTPTPPPPTFTPTITPTRTPTPTMTPTPVMPCSNGDLFSAAPEDWIINDCDYLYDYLIVVTSPGILQDVTVRVFVTHEYIGDIELYLQHPDGTTIDLTMRNGGNGDDYEYTIFDDDAATSITNGSPPFAGEYRPEEPLSTFDEKIAAGNWKLRTCDAYPTPTTYGQIHYWELCIKSAIPTPTPTPPPPTFTPTPPPTITPTPPPPTFTPTQVPTDTPTATPTQTVTPNGPVIGEVGYLQNSVDENWQTIQLLNTYVNPIVICQPLSDNGAQACVTRLRNMGPDSFEVRLKEPAPCYDDNHSFEAVSYIVIEAGSYILPDGAVLEADSLVTTMHSPDFESITFNQIHAIPPVVLSQIQTCADPEYVKTRFQAPPDTIGFNVTMEPASESGYCVCYEHIGEETVSWIAFSPGAGVNNGSLYESANTDQLVTAVFYQQLFTQTFAVPPVFVAMMQTRAGTDRAAIRYQNLTATGVEVRVDEETCNDLEIDHNSNETVGYFAWQFPGKVVGITPTPTATPECIHHGDVNFSGDLTAGDAQTAFNITMGLYSPTYAEECAADCNGDGSVTAGDAQAIFGAVLGLDSCVDPI